MACAPKRTCFPDSLLDQSRTTDGTLRSEDTSPRCPPWALPHCGPGERPPHLRMYIEVFIGFKALFFTLRVVKKKALFDDEKPIAGGGEGGATRRERVRFLGTTRVTLRGPHSHGEPLGTPAQTHPHQLMCHIRAKASAGQSPTTRQPNPCTSGSGHKWPSVASTTGSSSPLSRHKIGRASCRERV